MSRLARADIYSHLILVFSILKLGSNKNLLEPDLSSSTFLAKAIWICLIELFFLFVTSIITHFFQLQKKNATGTTNFFKLCDN